MIKQIIAILGLLWLVLVSNSYAQTINSKGTASAAKSVSNSAVTVLDYQSGRKGWCIEPETVNIRCMPSDSSAAPTVTPTTTVGFLYPFGVITCHTNIPAIAATTNAQAIRLDCISTGAATGVDTWEE